MLIAQHFECWDLQAKEFQPVERAAENLVTQPLNDNLQPSASRTPSRLVSNPSTQSAGLLSCVRYMRTEAQDLFV